MRALDTLAAATYVWETVLGQSPPTFYVGYLDIAEFADPSSGIAEAAPAIVSDAGSFLFVYDSDGLSTCTATAPTVVAGIVASRLCCCSSVAADCPVSD